MIWSIDPSRFVPLEDFLLPTPLAAVVAVGLTAGLAGGGRVLARRLFGANITALTTVACGLALTAALALSVHLVAWAGAAALVPLRLVGWGIAAFGLWTLVGVVRALREAHPALLLEWRALPRLEQLLVSASIVAIAAIGLATLAPAADSDSLAYHLATPLDWLRVGQSVPRPDLFVARLAGLGEALNLFGLASGTDRFGATSQFAGLLAAVVTIAAFGEGRTPRHWALVLVGAVPLLAAYTQSQKWQQLPAVGLATAAALVLLGDGVKDRRRLWLAGVALGFAIGCKTSMLITAGVVGLVVLSKAYETGTFAAGVLAVGTTGLTLAGAVWLRVWALYGDPLSPLGERFRAAPDPILVACAQYLRDAGYPHTLVGIATLVRDSLVPLSPGRLTEVLGAGMIGIVIGARTRGVPRWLAVATIGCLVLNLLGGQLSARFWIEMYVLATGALCAAGLPQGRIGLAWKLWLGGQGAAALAIALFSAVTQFPGALSEDARERGLLRGASDYADTRWLAKEIPAGARVLSQLRSYAYSANEVAGYRSCIEMLPADPPYRACQIYRSLAAPGADYIVRRTPPDDGFVVGDAVASPTGQRAAFHEMTRNPFQTGISYELEILKVDPDRLRTASAAFAAANPWCGLSTTLAP